MVAINHTSYVDFLPAALAAMYRKRRLRFMIKAEMQEVKIVDFLIRHTKTIPVDRRAGAGRLRGGRRAAARGRTGRRLPGGDHQPQLRAEGLQDRRGPDGARRQVPIIPLIVWGAQRIWTKDHPKNWAATRFRSRSRSARRCAPPAPSTRLMAALRAEMTTLLHRVQEDYPASRAASTGCRAGSAAAPRRLDEARALDEAELAERARRADGQRQQ